MKKSVKIIALALVLVMCVGMFAACGSSEEEGSYTPVATQANALMEVKSGTADAAVVDYTMATAMTGEGTDYSDLMMIEDLTLIDEQYGIGFRNGSTMVDEVNKAIAALIEDGTLTEIAEKYGLEGSLLTDVTPSDEKGESEDDDWAYIKEKGTLVIGITEYAPMNYYDESGTLIGFDTEFAEAVCEYLGITPEFIVINWDTKETELESKIIDCLWNGLTVDDDRKENMDFSASYMNNKQVVVIQADDADKYTDVDSLKTCSIVAEQGSAGESAVADVIGIAVA